MNRAHSVLPAAALAALTLYGPVAAQNPSEPRERRYRIAVARADGIIVPFAEHDDGYWRPIWAGVETSRNYDVPLTIDDVQARWWGPDGPATKWWLWQRRGVADAMAVTGSRAVATPCGTEVGLATGYKPPAPVPPATVAPYPKAGLATTAPIDYEPIVPLARDAPAWARVEAAIAREFPRAELGTLYAMRWAHPTPAREREKTALDVRNVWHVPGSPFYYYEAMRRYPERNPPRGEEPCDLVTYVAGYLWEKGEERLRSAGSSALVSYCHLERAVFMWPLGAIREGPRMYWVLQVAGWNSESYSIVEVHPARGEVRARLSHQAGVCPLR